MSPPGGTVIGVSLKLYLDVPASERWAARVGEIASRHPATASGAVRLFVLPSLPALPGVRSALAEAPVEVGAQDLFWRERGAFTGGVSGADLRAVGCTIVEIGHLERRTVFGENERIVNLKMAAAFRTGLTPLLCVGETSRSSDASEEVAGQLESALFGIPEPAADPGLIVAYEPSWAIGAEEPADGDHVAEMVAVIRRALAARPWIEASCVIYGGSAGPGALMALHDSVDGLFLGRFAHDPDALERVLDEAVERGI